TFTLVTRNRIPGINEPAAPTCKNLDDLGRLVPAMLQFNERHFCAYWVSGSKLKIIQRDGDYLCVQTATPKYSVGNDPNACLWIRMSTRDAIGMPRRFN